MLDVIQQTIQESIDVKKALLENASLLTEIHKAADSCIGAYRRGNRILLAGNGGSAADAQHIAAEFVSKFSFDRPALPAIAVTTDTSMLTAIANDYGYENVFRRQLEANGRPGDVFIGISTSGKSRNILCALECCQTLRITSIGLTGDRGDMASCCDTCIRVPSSSTARIQEAHILIGHIICKLVEAEFFGPAAP
jgi:D-sedoheptulose 7-phosphate isomerase